MENIFVIKDLNVKTKNCYVEIDRNSGGYPYLTDLINAHRFYSKSPAIEYMETFEKENWILQKFIYHATDCALANER